MKLKTLAGLALGAAALTLGGTPEGTLGLLNTAQAQADAVRPEVGKHLRDASALIKAGKHKDALAKIRDAEAVSGRTASENAAIEGMRLSAAQGAGDADTMAKSFEALKAAGRIGGAQALQAQLAIAGTYLRANNASQAANWAQRYLKDGGTDPAAKQILANAQFKSGDMSAVLKDTLEEVQADEKAGRAPSRDKLNLLLYAAQKKGDASAESLAIEKLINYYPSKELWAQVLGGLQQKKSFSDRFVLDVYRLKLATGNLSKAPDYIEMAQLAAQAGFPEEGKKVVEQGMAANVLNQGAEAATAKRLSDFLGKKIGEAKAGYAEAEKAANEAKTGDELVKLGLAQVFGGDKASGLKLVDAGIAKGNFKRADDAKYYQGLAYYTAGDSAKAQAAWRQVKGSDGSGELSRLWIIHARSGKK
ncbi:hypothetical protein [Roseateles violae]|uniref:Tetratricopeptide repeat protein n=1 Tax=Roseateles violae TaxID=3058042 RepID=A0ABT8DXK8_9BURK|nr:hypothetical protein [Pelomonas sp. PFR6]MDN3922054.1 hypothetical protein [Pelomonas sp. PFR6]